VELESSDQSRHDVRGAEGIRVNVLEHKLSFEEKIRVETQNVRMMSLSALENFELGGSP
jgi:hypothetical protein